MLLKGCVFKITRIININKKLQTLDSIVTTFFTPIFNAETLKQCQKPKKKDDVKSYEIVI